jgi:hypothetical protein
MGSTDQVIQRGYRPFAMRLIWLLEERNASTRARGVRPPTPERPRLNGSSNSAK